MPDIDPSLVQDVDLLCLDAGNTVIFLDHARLAASCAEFGWKTTPEALIVAEGAAKLAIESGEARDFGWETPVAGSRTWGQLVGAMLGATGLVAARMPAALDALWVEHRAKNFWSLVPEGLVSSLARLRKYGVPVAIISNSEGTLTSVLEGLGIRRSFDLVVDSGTVGVEKPDPRIFDRAFNHFGVGGARALHLGDTYATDVLGARAAGMRVALIDPYGHFAGRHAGVPRVPGVREVAEALIARPK